MIGITVTLSIAVIVLVHGIRSGRRSRADERQEHRAAIERARTEVSFLDLVDGWSALPDRRASLIAGMHQSVLSELAADDEAAAARHARDLLQVLAPYRRVDIVDA